MKLKIVLLNIKSNKKGVINKDLAGGMGTRTIIGNSIFAKLIEFAKKNGDCLPVMNLAYLAAILSNKGHVVKFRETITNIDENNTDLVILNSSIVDCDGEKKVARQLMNKGINVGIIGTFASAVPEYFKNSCNFIITGEPEGFFMITELLSSLKGIYKSNQISDLDSLPFPKWDIFPFKNYSYFPNLKNKPFLPILSSRGCPYSCGYYCPYPIIQGKTFRMRSAINVVNEIEKNLKFYNTKAILFRDPIFTLNKRRVFDIANEIIKRKIKIEWACETRLDLLDKEIINRLYQSGLRSINVGVESFNEEVLKNFSRIPIQKDKQEEIISYCDKKGIKISAFYILGLPKDTKKSILSTIKYAKKLNTHIAQFSVRTPYPGTKDYDNLKKLNPNLKFETFTGYTPVINHENLSFKEIKKLREKAFLDYYYRFNYIKSFLKRMLR